MAAALRHVVRRLMAEERRQLFSRSRLFHTHGQPRKINDGLYRVEQKKAELYDLLPKAKTNPEAIDEHDMQLLKLIPHFRRQLVPEVDDILWQRERFVTRVNSVLEGIARTAFYICITALAYGITTDKGVKDQTIDEGSQ
ncbi:uncharacterized protein [Triticum aestivum]|uniref:uncharacterized protein n=1 Tax=Triticum aestivum TaxID=4565 RepID=UPI001D008E96|nr:uncharacterized protein LOC123179549 [Triticum aestivum]